MRLFEGDPYDGYQRIRRSAPSFWNGIAEAQAIWQTAGIEHDKIRAAITKTTCSVLVPWADEEALEVYERYFGIEYTDGLAPDVGFRRAMVAAQFTGQRHIGRPEIQELANRFSKRNETEVHLDHGTVIVRINAYGGFSDDIAFFKMLRKKLPAHLGMKAELNIIRECRYPVRIGLGARMMGSFPEEYRTSTVASFRKTSVRTGALSITKVTGQLIPRKEGE